MDCPVLWLACRRHVAELHLGAAVKQITGQTKDPGVAVFRRLRAQWSSLEIDYGNLVKWDYLAASEKLQAVAADVLAWGQEQLQQRTFPRDDYKEFLELVVISLGGHVEGFKFKLPGPDHHARWMSKAIYNLKMKLISKFFHMSEVELSHVNQIAEFVVLFYAKFWFTTPLAASAARMKLDFMSHILEYRVVDAPLAFTVLESAYRHLWYLTAQLIPLALTDTGLEDSSREAMARALHGQTRGEIKTGKPIFPILPYGATVARQNMASLIGPESWLVFDLLQLLGPQDWLLTPPSTWKQAPSFKALQDFTRKLTVVNDLAERGCHLATEFINRVRQFKMYFGKIHRTQYRSSQRIRGRRSSRWWRSSGRGSRTPRRRA